MHELYELKEMLCKELEEYSKKDLSAGSLEVVDKLAHAAKNIGKLIEMYEKDDGYSSMGMGGSYARGGRGGNSNRGGSYQQGGGSYARGRGSNARRDSRGRYSNEGYSRENEVVAELYELMEEVDDDRIKSEMQKFVRKIENM